MKLHIPFLIIFLFSPVFRKDGDANAALDTVSFDDHAHCPCQCRIEQDVLRQVYTECQMYSYEKCKVSFCLKEDRPGFSCCDEDMSGSALGEINVALEGAQSTNEAYLFDEYDLSESAETYLADEYNGSESAKSDLDDGVYASESPLLEPSYDNVQQHNENVFSSEEPCHHKKVSPTVSVSATGTPSPTATASVTASATPTRTPSTSPSPTITPSVSPSPSPKFATLHYAVDNEAYVYVNGVLISALTDWKLFETVSFPLKRNDVVAILAQDNGGWYGLIAALYVGDRWYLTGRDEWKAIKAFEFPGDDELWTVPFFNTCSWDLVEARPNADVIFNGKAPNFPYETGAQYVWADDAGENDGIFVRFVLGGEDCS